MVYSVLMIFAAAIFQMLIISANFLQLCVNFFSKKGPRGAERSCPLYRAVRALERLNTENSSGTKKIARLMEVSTLEDYALWRLHCNRDMKDTEETFIRSGVDFSNLHCMEKVYFSTTLMKFKVSSLKYIKNSKLLGNNYNIFSLIENKTQRYTCCHCYCYRSPQPSTH